MNRRELVQVVLATAAAHSVATTMGCAASPKGAAAGPKEGEKKDHEHCDHEAAAGGAVPLATSEQKALAKAAAACLVAGHACLAHCLRDLGTGSTAMKDCALAVTQMIAVCDAMSKLAAMGSKHAGPLSSICKSACKDCAEACRPHKDHHGECGDCFAACEATIALIA